MLSRTVLRTLKPLNIVSITPRCQLLRFNSSKSTPNNNNNNSNNSNPSQLDINDEIFKKYSQQLQKKAQELGIPLNELRIKFQDKIEKVKLELGGIDPTEELKQFFEHEKQKKQQNQNDNDDGTIKIRGIKDRNAPKLPYKVLDNYINLSKAKELPRDDIIKIWTARFINNDRALHAILTHLQFAQLYTNAFKYPQFVLPLPKPQQDGYELEFVQWQFVGPNTINCMFTTLAEYKLHGEYASPHTTLTFHLELAQDKDLVLMNGFNNKESGISMDEAHLLVVMLQRFYSGKNPQMTQLLHEFNKGNAEFDIDALIKQATSV